MDEMPKFEEYQITSLSDRDVRQIVRDELAFHKPDCDIAKPEPDSLVSALGYLFFVMALVIGVGVVTLFGCEVAHYFFKVLPDYTPVSRMPWTLAGLTSSVAAVLVALWLFLSGD